MQYEQKHYRNEDCSCLFPKGGIVRRTRENSCRNQCIRVSSEGGKDEAQHQRRTKIIIRHTPTINDGIIALALPPCLLIAIVIIASRIILIVNAAICRTYLPVANTSIISDRKERNNTCESFDPILIILP